MTRIETVTAIAAAALIAVGYSPALAQRSEKDKGDAFIIIDGGTKHVTPEVKSGKGQRSTRASQPAEPPKPPEPTLTVQGGFEKSKELARESAIRVAVDKLHDYLLEQNPPVTQKPNTKFVQEHLIRDLEKIEPSDEPIMSRDGKPEQMYRATIALKVDAKDIRDLRSQDRSSEALWILAGLGGLALVVAGFFRIDAWTKGYLTSWLALGTVGAASLLAGLWWWAK
jgi:hypothetical protein